MAIQEAAVDNRREAVPSVETFDTIVIGGGQAGLAVGYYLKKRGRSFVILDAPGGHVPGARFDCSPPRATTGYRAGRSPLQGGRTRLRARRPTTSRPMRRDSIFPCEPRWQ